jgi:hypothetical protein
MQSYASQFESQKTIFEGGTKDWACHFDVLFNRSPAEIMLLIEYKSSQNDLKMNMHETKCATLTHTHRCHLVAPSAANARTTALLQIHIGYVDHIDANPPGRFLKPARL